MWAFAYCENLTSIVMLNTELLSNDARYWNERGVNLERTRIMSLRDAVENNLLLERITVEEKYKHSDVNLKGMYYILTKPWIRSN